MPDLSNTRAALAAGLLVLAGCSTAPLLTVGLLAAAAGTLTAHRL